MSTEGCATIAGRGCRPGSCGRRSSRGRSGLSAGHSVVVAGRAGRIGDGQDPVQEMAGDLLGGLGPDTRCWIVSQ